MAVTNFAVQAKKCKKKIAEKTEKYLVKKKSLRRNKIFQVTCLRVLGDFVPSNTLGGLSRDNRCILKISDHSNNHKIKQTSKSNNRVHTYLKYNAKSVDKIECSITLITILYSSGESELRISLP